MTPCKRCGLPLGDHRFKSVMRICAKAQSDPARTKAAQHAVLSKMMPRKAAAPKPTVH